jgi:hypothetical protein
VVSSHRLSNSAYDFIPTLEHGTLQTDLEYSLAAEGWTASLRFHHMQTSLRAFSPRTTKITAKTLYRVHLTTMNINIFSMAFTKYKLNKLISFIQLNKKMFPVLCRRVMGHCFLILHVEDKGEVHHTSVIGIIEM